MKMNQSRNRSTEPVESCVTSTLTDMLGHEPVGLLAAGIDPSGLLLGLLGPATGTDAGTEEFFTADPFSLFPEAAKRKVVEDEDEDDDDDEEEDEDDVADEEEDEEEDEEVEEDEDVDEDEEEEDEDDDEEEEEDEFDDPDDDDDYDDDDDDEDFDDDE